MRGLLRISVYNYVDRHLNFETHVDNVTRKCTGILIALSHTRSVLPRGTLKCIVEALVMSSVRYCLSIYWVLWHDSASTGSENCQLLRPCRHWSAPLRPHHQIISAAPVAERGTVSRLSHCMRAGTYPIVWANRLFARHHWTEGQPETCI